DEKHYQDFLAVIREKWQPSKAAFYVLETTGGFKLKTQFGFTRADRLADKLARMDPLAVQVYEHREPFFINNIHQAGKLAGLMESASSTRILTAPLYVDGRIAGILDVRDKAGRAPFTPNDLNDVSDMLRRFAVSLRKLKEGVVEEDLPPLVDNSGRMLERPPAPGATGAMRPPGMTTSSFNTAAFNTASFATGGLHAAAAEAAPAEPVRRGAPDAPAPAVELSTAHLPSPTI